MKNRNRKKPRTAIVPIPVKQPRVEPSAANWNSRRPSWHVGLMDLDGRWGWKSMSESEALELHEKLKSFESMTWQEVIQGTGSHRQQDSPICNDARGRLQELELDDFEDSLFSIRLSGKGRLWGITEESGILRLLWWDPDHTVLPVSKKHT